MRKYIWTKRGGHFQLFELIIISFFSLCDIIQFYKACPPGPWKCCLYQEMNFSLKGNDIGKIEEECFCCVPRYHITDASGEQIYKVHSPTCCAGLCVNCCSEGNPCGKGCCKLAFHIFPADQEDTDNGAPYTGKIVKVRSFNFAVGAA